VLSGTVTDFSGVIGAFGLGGLVGAIALLGVDPDRDRQTISSWFSIVYGAVVCLVALNSWLWGLTALLAVAGAAVTISNTSANSLLQGTAPSRLRGQTASLYMLALRGGMSFGGLLTGASIGLLGVRNALLVNGLAAVAGQILLVWISHDGRRK